MWKWMILCALIFLPGCHNITQDDFSIGRREIFTMHSEYGDITIDLLFQDESMRTIMTAEEIAHIYLATMRAFEEHFGYVPDAPRRISVMEIRIDSSQWQSICMDNPNDSWHIDGCSSDWMYPQEIEGLDDWEVAINSSMYHRAERAEGLYVHEFIHGLMFNTPMDDVNTHSHPGVWEHDAGSVYWRALANLSEEN